MFGARLDSNVAGGSVVVSGADEEHERLFKRGVSSMQGGRYGDAVSFFTQAVAAAPGGLTSRLGGQYSVWLAQALEAQGRKKDAALLLQRCEVHPDADVRKISSNVLYILRAPQLKLSEENFVQFDLGKEQQFDFRTRKGTVKKEPPPEKYSLEWYQEEYKKKQERGEATKEQRLDVALIGVPVVLGGTLALILTSSH